MATWYGVKGLFRWYFKDTGATSDFEERVLLIQAESFEEAIAQAEQEAQTYCTEDPAANFRIESTGYFNAYLIDESPVAGVEVYSRLMSSSLSTTSFMHRYYPKGHDR